MSFNGSSGSKGSKGVVRCIIIRKRHGVLEYTLFAKDKKAVNIQNPLNL